METPDADTGRPVGCSAHDPRQDGGRVPGSGLREPEAEEGTSGQGEDSLAEARPVWFDLFTGTEGGSR